MSRFSRERLWRSTADDSLAGINQMIKFFVRANVESSKPIKETRSDW